MAFIVSWYQLMLILAMLSGLLNAATVSTYCLGVLIEFKLFAVMMAMERFK